MNNPKIFYKFDDYVVDVSEKRLLHHGEIVPLTPKPFDILLVLLERPGELVEKDLLLESVWPETFVEESNLAQNISTLRKALGTPADGGKYIETMLRRGYRFVAPVEEIVADTNDVLVNRHVHTEVTEISEESVIESRDSFSIGHHPGHLLRLSFVRRNLLAVMVFVGAAVLLSAALFIALRSGFRAAEERSVLNGLNFSTILSNANLVLVAISNDGKYVAYAERQGSDERIMLRSVEGAASVEIVPHDKIAVSTISFSESGDRIYFARKMDEDSPGKVFEVELLGGVPKVVHDNVNSVIAPSPDGKQFAFLRNDLSAGLSTVQIASFGDIAAERVAASFPFEEKRFVDSISWSPDGNTLAVTVLDRTANSDMRLGIDSINLADGSQHISEQKWGDLGSLSWCPDSSGIVFRGSQRHDGNNTNAVWKITNPGGAAQQITSGTAGYFDMSLTNDGKHVLIVRSTKFTTLWNSSSDDLTSGQRLYVESPEYNYYNPGISSFGNDQLIYGKSLNGNLDIWRMNYDGSGQKQLTVETSADYDPVGTADGRYILFVSNRSGHQNVWRMDPDGSNATQLTDELNVDSLSVPDAGQNVYFSAFDLSGKKMVLKTVPVTGGKTHQLSERHLFRPSVSPDGALIACYSPDASDKNAPMPPLRLTVISTETGSVIHQYSPAASSMNFLLPIVWNKDSKSFRYLTRNFTGSLLWEQNIDSGDPSLKFNSSPEAIYSYTRSPDGTRAVFEKGSIVNDLIVITGSPKPGMEDSAGLELVRSVSGRI